MATSFFVFLFALFSAVLSQPPPPLTGLLIDCGATNRYEDDGLTWLPDAPYVSEGQAKSLPISGLVQQLSTVRVFPFRPPDGPRKFCYSFPVTRGDKYLVRTTFFYGAVNGQRAPPVFYLIVDWTIWTVVDTKADYEKNMSSYYEGVYKARGRNLAICLGANSTTESDPFISAIELIVLDDSLYNSTDFGKHAMGLVARTGFGHNSSVLRYPSDQFDRFWQPYGDGTQDMTSSPNVPVSEFWNLPPVSIMATPLRVHQSEPLSLKWPPMSLPNSSYYVALYFADPSSERVNSFNVSLNGITFIGSLNVTSAGASVFATRWPLSGQTTLTLTPSGANLPPVINGGEIFSLLTLGGWTLPRDAIALDQVKRSIQNPPPNWNGDPCSPPEFSWTGITCLTWPGPRFRIAKLNLSNMGLSGNLSIYIANLTAVSEILLDNNSFSGSIPDLRRLGSLQKLHLQDNEFTGNLPPSLGNLTNLRELFVQNNNLSGEIPESLKRRRDLQLRTVPGNNFTGSPSN